MIHVPGGGGGRPPGPGPRRPRVARLPFCLPSNRRLAPVRCGGAVPGPAGTPPPTPQRPAGVSRPPAPPFPQPPPAPPRLRPRGRPRCRRGAGRGGGAALATRAAAAGPARFASPRLGAAAPPPQVRAAAPRSGGWGSSRGGARRRGAAFPVESNGEGGTTTGGGAAGRLPSPPTPRLPSGSRCEAGTAPHLSVPGGGPKTLAALLGTERRGCPRAPRDGGGQGGRPGAGGRRCPGPEEPPRGGPRLPCRWVPGRQRLAGWVLSAPEVRRERQTLRSDGEEDGTVVTSLTHLSAVRGDRMLLYL